jgi:hypothetical protein
MTSVTTDGGERSYYGRPIIKEPVWKPEIAWYFFCGGLGGAGSALAAGAHYAGYEQLERVAARIGLAGLALSPPLLIKDLGRPRLFLNMFRVFKVTSPMSVGSWILAAAGSAAGAAVTLGETGRLPRLHAAAQYSAGILGLPVTTYTAALVAQSVVPVWHRARHELPFAFAGSAAAAAAGAAAAFTPPDEAGPARRLAVIGALTELAATKVMEKRLGVLAEPYEKGEGGAYGKAAKAFTAAGAVTMATVGRRRAGAALAGALLCAGSACFRFSVWKAGIESARDPKYTVIAQREQ